MGGLKKLAIQRGFVPIVDDYILCGDHFLYLFLVVFISLYI